MDPRRLGWIVIVSPVDNGIIVAIEHQVQVGKQSRIEFQQLRNPPDRK